MSDYAYVTGDTKTLRARLSLLSEAGVLPADLTGATVVLEVWRPRASDTLQTLAATVTDATAGAVSCDLTPTTAAALTDGTWHARWVVTYASTAKRSYPELQPHTLSVYARAG